MKLFSINMLFCLRGVSLLSRVINVEPVYSAVWLPRWLEKLQLFLDFVRGKRKRAMGKNIKTVICIASGPSLTAEDCSYARLSGFPCIAINSSWQAMPESEFLFASDLAWWDANSENLPAMASRWTTSILASHRYGLNLYRPRYHAGFCSGSRAIEFAVENLGARRVLLLGFDCSIKEGMHWHGAHGGGLKNPNASSIELWLKAFSSLAMRWGEKVEIINCSRRTELTCFPRENLESALARLS